MRLAPQAPGLLCALKRGLGIRNLSSLNRALLCKWSWCFAIERDSYWKLIISRGWSSRGVREGYGVGLWKEIGKEGSLLLNNVSFSMGDGKRDSMGEEERWTPCFSRPFNDWEVEEVEKFLSTIQGKRLNADVEDRMSRFHGALFGARMFLQRWVFLLGKPHGGRDQLKRRDWILANRCSLCCAEEETINHILVHCSKAKVLWDLVFSLFGGNWVLSSTVRDTLLGWCAFFKNKKHRKAKSSIVVGPLSLINFVDWLGSC
ncbi:hypothetical protein CK203_015494 [Vitis vinifera]|uniref:Reverse transcriptase zinc-binding domain-containing protein n=1 Tax=Vitis vinifera TaxID=29760 RepID=A0A438J550_VITVI|nr:hypothetical protein CK203_015494 [Vitis vinifera]